MPLTSRFPTKYCGPSSIVEEDRQIAGLSAVIVLHPVGHAYVAKAVRFVQVDDGRLVALHQARAIPPVRKLKERGALQEHALANRIGAEILVSRDLDFHQLVARAGIDQVIDVGLVVGDALLLELHIGFEIPLGLKVVLKVVRALGQQVVIHRVLLENRHVALQLPWTKA